MPITVNCNLFEFFSPCPWGVSSHMCADQYSITYVCAFSRSVLSESLWPFELQSTRLLCPWNFSGKNTEVGCHFFLQGIFLTQGMNLRLLCLLYCVGFFTHWAIREVPLSHTLKGNSLQSSSLCSSFLCDTGSRLGLLGLSVSSLCLTDCQTTYICYT